MRVAFRVIELAPAQEPPERRQPQAAKGEADRDKQAQHLHQRSLKALSETVNDEDDIASAAIRGEQRPATASGTANRL